MEPTRELVDALFREKLERARRMSPDDKFLAGARLFERSCRIMMDGIRAEHPDADENRVRKLLRERLALLRRLEEADERR
jgi:hypothetical protein